MYKIWIINQNLTYKYPGNFLLTTLGRVFADKRGGQPITSTPSKSGLNHNMQKDGMILGLHF